jgi:hypothetical protein
MEQIARHWRWALYGNRTGSSSLIRNLGLAFWFGTPRVIEQDKAKAQTQKRDEDKRNLDSRDGPWATGKRLGFGSMGIDKGLVSDQKGLVSDRGQHIN